MPSAVPLFDMSMVLVRALIVIVSSSTLAMACTCAPPPGLCSRLEPNMVAFIGRPISTVQLDKRHSQTTFRVEERIWGSIPADSILVDGASFSAEEPQKSWFILAGRRTDDTRKGGNAYFVNFSCCPYGLELPADHAWAKEFRDNVARLKPATIGAEVISNWITLADLNFSLHGPGYFWQGVSRRSGIPLRLPLGEYTVSIANPHFTLEEANRHASILPGSCAAWRIDADPTTSVSGRIVDSRRLSTQGLIYHLEGEVDPGGSSSDSVIDSVQRSWYRMMGWGDPPIQRVISVQRATYSVHPDSTGRFHARVLPGKYRLTVVSSDNHRYVFPPPIPMTYYPGVIEKARATEMVVPPDGNVGNLYFELPDYGPTRRVEVVLVNEDGSPASNVVVAHTGTYPGDQYRTAGWTQKLTDSLGRASFDVWQSLDYDLRISESPSGDKTHIPAGSEPVSRKFVIRRRQW